MESLGVRAGQATATATTSASISSITMSASIRDRLNAKLSANGCLLQAQLDKRQPAYQYFKRPALQPPNSNNSETPFISASPFAGIDPNFLKPKIFPEYLKLSPKLYFDFGEGMFTTKATTAANEGKRLLV